MELTVLFCAYGNEEFNVDVVEIDVIVVVVVVVEMATGAERKTTNTLIL